MKVKLIKKLLKYLGKIGMTNNLFRFSYKCYIFAFKMKIGIA